MTVGCLVLTPPDIDHPNVTAERDLFSLQHNKMERTCVLLKPDAVGRGLNFQITERFEKREFKLLACRMLQATKEEAEAYYAPLKGKAGFDDAVAFLTSGPIVATAWEAPGVLAAALSTAGAADPAKAALGTVRGDLAVDNARNLIECSADAAAAKRELALWFTPAQLGGGGGAASSAGGAAAAATAAGGGAVDVADSGGEGGKSKAQLKKEAKEAKKAEKKGPLGGGGGSGDGRGRGRGKAAAEPQDTTFYEPPSGTRDFFPDDMRVRNWLFGRFRETARRFAFQEYDAPVLENVALYERKAGEEITDQMYNFTDKDDKRVTLRPEMTPTLARMILSLGDRFLKPVKWFSVPQCWRFETVQRGRKREHYQWNMDIIGEAGISAEVELLAAITSFFLSVGVTSADVGIKVNSRKVLSTILAVYGVSKDMFERVCVIVDKLDKIGPEATVEQLVPVGVPEEAAKQIVASLSLKSIGALKELAGAEGKEAVEELETLFETAKAYGFDDWLIFDASVVRGLAYYTGIVFEGFDRKGELRAICGGGRYDKLLSLYGSPEVVPACGFGFGDCVIMELLREKKVPPTPCALRAACSPHSVLSSACSPQRALRTACSPHSMFCPHTCTARPPCTVCALACPLSVLTCPARVLQVLPELKPEIDFVVMAYSESMRAGQVAVAAKLRAAGYAVDVLLEPAKKIAKAFSYADRVNGRRSLFIAPSEWEAGNVRMKDLRAEGDNADKQVDLPFATLVEALAERGIGPMELEKK